MLWGGDYYMCYRIVSSYRLLNIYLGHIHLRLWEGLSGIWQAESLEMSKKLPQKSQQ